MNEKELLDAHDELMKAVRSPAPPEDDRRITGALAGWVLPRMRDCAARLGYPVRYYDEAEMAADGRLALGATVTRNYEHGGLQPAELRLLRGMTPASQARTLAHELNHALQSAYAARVSGRIEGGSLEEIVAETGGALICRALRVPGEASSLAYLAMVRGRGNGTQLLRQSRDEAVNRAHALLGAMR